jgi:outer membrane lipoprotein SlyB
MSGRLERLRCHQPRSADLRRDGSVAGATPETTLALCLISIATSRKDHDVSEATRSGTHDALRRARFTDRLVTGRMHRRHGEASEQREAAMRRSGATLLCLVFLGQAVAGCATMSEEQKGAAIGAGAGAVLGGLAGALLDSKNPGRGAALGAAAGTVLGGAAGWGIGAHRAKQVKTREQATADLNYRPEQGLVTRLDGTSVIPQQVRPGDQVMLQTQYVILAPPQSGPVKVKETRTIFFNNQLVKQFEKETVLEFGTHNLQQVITLPNTAAEGPYTVVTTVQPVTVASARKAEGQAGFVVGGGTASPTGTRLSAR